MAKDAEADSAGEFPAAKPKKRLVLVMVVFNVLALAGIAGFVANRGYGHTKKTPNAAAADAAEATGDAALAADLGPTVSLGSFVVNLNEPGAPRYLRVTLKIEVSNQKVENEMKLRDAQLKDIVITYLSSLGARQTQGGLAMDEIRQNIQRRLNSVLKTGTVKRIYIAEFVTQ